MNLLTLKSQLRSQSQLSTSNGSSILSNHKVSNDEGRFGKLI